MPTGTVRKMGSARFIMSPLVLGVRSFCAWLLIDLFLYDGIILLFWWTRIRWFRIRWLFLGICDRKTFGVRLMIWINFLTDIVFWFNGKWTLFNEYLMNYEYLTFSCIILQSRQLYKNNQNASKLSLLCEWLMYCSVLWYIFFEEIFVNSWIIVDS